jgi:hypothetical protein
MYVLWNFSQHESCISHIYLTMVLILTGGDFGPVGGHSLSWSSEKGDHVRSIMIAKVWTPEDPRTGRPMQTYVDAA